MRVAAGFLGIVVAGEMVVGKLSIGMKITGFVVYTALMVMALFGPPKQDEKDSLLEGRID